MAYIFKVFDESGREVIIPAIKGEPGRTPVCGVDYPKLEITNGRDPFGAEYVNVSAVIETEEGTIAESIGSIRQPKDGRTPVKGEDYFTEEDIATMTQNVRDTLEHLWITAKMDDGTTVRIKVNGIIEMAVEV